MGNFEFKSQVATTKEQSERLLELGLKKETADMMYITDVNVPEEYRHYDLVTESKESCLENIIHVPAWSLHRLIEMLPDSVAVMIEKKDGGYDEIDCYLWIRKDEVSYWPWGADGYASDSWKIFNKDNLCDNVVDAIECLIEKGLFSINYLKDNF